MGPLGRKRPHICSIERKTPALQSDRVPCVASTARGTEGEEDQMARSSA